MSYNLNNKTALVTGGARDIGRAIAIKLAESGAAVAVNYNASEKAAHETVAMIEKSGGHAVAIQADVTNAADVQKLVEETKKTFGKNIHLLVNNAGGLVARKKMDEMDEDFWNAVIRLNLTSLFLVTKAVLPVMVEGGAIVNLASLAGRDGGGSGAIAYATCKGGVITFTHGLAKELGPRKIRVNCVSPGLIGTTFHDTFTKPEVRQRIAAMTPLGREGTAEEVAEAIAFLASDAASFINGASIEINGGLYFV
jgi:3-oxoacyl-[acyl-carrier protein] reductase